MVIQPAPEQLLELFTVVEKDSAPDVEPFQRCGRPATYCCVRTSISSEFVPEVLHQLPRPTVAETELYVVEMLLIYRPDGAEDGSKLIVQYLVTSQNVEEQDEL